jgi:uncharacterized protein DUF4412
MSVAIIQPIDSSATLQMMQKLGSSVTVQNLGSETVGSYSCTHFVMNITNPNVKNTNAGRKDIWITNDLKGSCNILYTGPYLYYASGDYLQRKLAEAGATGVVVEWQTGSSVCMLSGYQAKNLPSSLFTVPSNYSVTNAPAVPN